MHNITRARTVLTAVLLSAASIAGVGAALPSASSTPPPAGLSISIDNGTKATGPDSDVTYKVTLSNSGAGPITAWVKATVPDYAKITDPGGGDTKDHDNTWKVDVEAGKKHTETFKAHIGAIPKGTYRVTTLASVYLADDTTGAPVIRSADSDTIPGVKEPTGATPTPTAAATDHTTGSQGTVLTIVIVGALVIAAVVVLITVVLLRRRRNDKPTGRRNAERQEISAHE
jgi:hypothetical protein